MNDHQTIVDEINGLIHVCINGEEGFRNAAAHINNSELASEFEKIAHQRAKFAKDLQGEVERLGGDAAHSGTLTGAMHRGWVDLKSALTGGDAGAVVAACETGDDSAVAAFERVVDGALPGESRSLVEKQWRQIQETHNRLLALKAGAARGVEFPDNK